MQKHPDADSFMREYLAHPTDATTRLVFADWLEETGAAHNAAWAYYIRLRDDAEHHPADSREQRELLRQADDYTSRIRAKLTMSATRFVGYPKSLLQLLPAANITVRLANFAVPRPVIEFMPESVARENIILPLDLQGDTLLIASADPHNTDTAQKLEFILNRDIVLVGAEQDDMIDAINRHWAYAEYETVDSPPLFLTEFVTTSRWVLAGEAPTEPPPESEPVVRLVNLCFVGAINLRADRLLFYPDVDAVGMRLRVGGEWAEGERIPHRLLRPVTARVALMALIDADQAFLGVGEPLTGEISLRVHDMRVRLHVTILPSPDGPTTQIDITREPVV